MTTKEKKPKTPMTSTGKSVSPDKASATGASAKLSGRNAGKSANGGSVLQNVLSRQADVVQLIRRGLPYSTVDAVTEHFGLDVKDVRHIVKLTDRTVARRKQNPRPLDASQSERLIRVVKVMGLASEVLEDEDRARQWLKTSNIALNDECPLELLDTGIGFERVMDVLRRIEFGVYS